MKYKYALLGMGLTALLTAAALAALKTAERLVRKAA